MPRIRIDFETRSIADLRTLGADVYARHWSTAPTMLSIVVPHLDVAYVEDFLLGCKGYQACQYPFADPHDIHFKWIKPPVPPLIQQAIDEGWTFVAHNARFEQAIWFHICVMQWGWPMPTKWSCTAARARYWGLRANLDGTASDLEIVHQKNEFGKTFINDFCKPRKYKGAKKHGIIKLLWKEPQDDMESWQKGVQYCLEDALAEGDIDDLLPDLPEFEQQIWDLDFKMNTRGLPIDTKTVNRAVQFSAHFTDMAFKRFDEITALRPTQRDKVLEYINQREEIDKLGDLRSKTLKRIVLDDLPPDLRDIIQIRLDTSKASIRKLETMQRCTDDDGRARGLFLYGGAHTMRWSAKRIQPQNFTRPNPDYPPNFMFDYLEHPVWDIPADEMPDQPLWIEEANLRFTKPLAHLSSSMRGFIKAPKGKIFRVADLAQIEVRVNMWLARCMWVLDAFRAKQDVYVKFAADHMLHIPYDDFWDLDGKLLKRFKPDRQKAKSAELGCGYQMSGRAFMEYCDNVDLIISLDEATAIVRQYREGHPELADWNVGLWSRAEQAAIAAVRDEGRYYQLRGTAITYHVHRIDQERWWLICTLPSGRHIAYYRPKVRLGTRFGRTVEKLSYRNEWNGRSYREDTYGGKLVENFVQGTARDVCALGALNAERAGYNVIGLVHDETITEVDEDFGSHEELAMLLCQLPDWITDLPVEAEGGSMVRYGK